MIRKIGWILFGSILIGFMFVVWLQNYYFVTDTNKEGQVIEVWNKPPSRLVKERKLWEESVLRFENKYPGLKIKGVERQYSPQEFVTAMAGGKGPDVMHVWIGSLAILARQGFIAPVDKYIKHWDQADYIPKKVWRPTRYQRKTFGVPKDTYFTVLFYRKDLFKKAGLNPNQPPRTWAELVDYAKKLTDPSIGQYGFGLPPNTWHFMDFVWQNQGRLIEATERGYLNAPLNSKEVLETLQFWHDLKYKHKVLPKNSLPTEENISQMFALGKVAMVMGVAMQLPTLLNKYGLDLNKAGIAPLPAGPDGVRASHAGGEVYVINASISREKQEAAWKYIEHELSPANQLWKWVRMNELKMTIFPGAFSASTNLLNMPEFAMVKEELQYVRNEPHLPEWPLMKDALDKDLLQAIFVNENINIKEYVDEFTRRVNQQFLSKRYFIPKKKNRQTAKHETNEM